MGDEDSEMEGDEIESEPPRYGDLKYESMSV